MVTLFLPQEMLIRVFLGWLRGEPRHCKMVAIPTLEEEDARRPSRERESPVGERTRIINRMKAALIRRGIRGFKPELLKVAGTPTHRLHNSSPSAHLLLKGKGVHRTGANSKFHFAPAALGPPAGSYWPAGSLVFRYSPTTSVIGSINSMSFSESATAAAREVECRGVMRLLRGGSQDHSSRR